MLPLAKNAADLFWRPVCFAGVGLANTLVDFAILLELSRVLLWPPTLANIVSYSCGLLCSYMLNSRLTFKSRTSSWRFPFLIYICANILGILTNCAIVFMAAPSLGLILAKSYAIVASFAVNYLLSRFFVFSTERETHRQ